MSARDVVVIGVSAGGLPALVRPIEAGDGRNALILLAMEDVTRQREATRSGH